MNQRRILEKNNIIRGTNQHILNTVFVTVCKLMELRDKMA